MGHKQIKIKLTSESIAEAIKEVNELIELSNNRALFVCAKIAQRTQELAQSYFDDAWKNHMGRGERQEVHVNVVVEKTQHGYKVVAQGEDAVWVEFGTGVHFNGNANSSPHPRGNELGFTIGGYGKHHGLNDSWAFKDEFGSHITRGTEAQMPLYRAFMQAKSEILND